MVQPGSAVVIVAASSARDVVAGRPTDPVVSAGTGTSAMTGTWQGLAAVCGAATSTPAPASTRSPGARPPTTAGGGVATPGPSTRTPACPGPAPMASGPPPGRVTRTIASGRPTVPPNRSVEATPLIRMPHRCTNPRSRRADRGGELPHPAARDGRRDSVLGRTPRPSRGPRAPATPAPPPVAGELA